MLQKLPHNYQIKGSGTLMTMLYHDIRKASECSLVIFKRLLIPLAHGSLNLVVLDLCIKDTSYT